VTQPEATRRESRVSEGTRLLHADLHNHTMLSDGAGDPEVAFGLLRRAGLDVAALTDHASIPRHDIARLDPADYPDAEAVAMARMAPHSLDAAGWERTAQLADAADVPGEFTALRGFEWTEPWLGHACVWFSAAPRHVDTPGRVAGLHRWLAEQEPEALFGYNHPGREPGRFHDFAPAPQLVDRMVTLEAFNRYDDYLFQGWAMGRPSPLAACLDAGWRPGLIGVSDEHSRSYGVEGKGRAGLWAREHSRAGVREALLARRTFATREVGLLLDATLDGVRMGSAAPGGGGRRELAIDLAGPTYDGRPAELQLLTSRQRRAGEVVAPGVVALAAATVGSVARVEVDVPRDCRWLLLRVADPSTPQLAAGPAGHPANAYGVAYASPWYFD
jgi:hypothetical protein